MPGRIVAKPGDVTDRAAMARSSRRSRASGDRARLPQRGRKFPRRFRRFRRRRFCPHVRLNVHGAVNCPIPSTTRCARASVDRSRSSLRWRAMADCPSRRLWPQQGGADLARRGHEIRRRPPQCDDPVVNPGFVRTELTADRKSPMPLLMESAAAAAAFATAGAGRLRDPLSRRLAWMMRAIRPLPYPVYFALLKMGFAATRADGLDARRSDRRGKQSRRPLKRAGRRLKSGGEWPKTAKAGEDPRGASAQRGVAGSAMGS